MSLVALSFSRGEGSTFLARSPSRYELSCLDRGHDRRTEVRVVRDEARRDGVNPLRSS